MTRLAIVSAVHADVHALDDALAQAERLSCEVVVCAGDIVDYGLFPQETIDLLIEKSVPCIRGNHDRWAVGRGRADAPHALEEEPRDTSGWDLTPAALEYLAERPPAWDAVIDGIRVAVRHATPRSDMEGIYPEKVSMDDARRWLEESRADVLLVGHTHIPFALSVLGGGGLIANPGALLRSNAERQESTAWIFEPDLGTFVPGPAPGGGTFGVLELPARCFRVLRASDVEEVDIPRLTPGVHDRCGC